MRGGATWGAYGEHVGDKVLMLCHSHPHPAAHTWPGHHITQGPPQVMEVTGGGGGTGATWDGARRHGMRSSQGLDDMACGQRVQTMFRSPPRHTHRNLELM